MNIFTYNNLNIKKLKKYKYKVLFLVIPISILVGLSLFVSSGVKNITSAINESFFETIAQQSTLLELSKIETETSSSPQGGQMRSFSMSDTSNTFTENDISQVENISNVVTAAISSAVPVTNVKTTDLFDDKTVSLSSLVGLDSDLAGIYTDQDFTYTEGEAIPIVLNANTFTESYEDWDDQDSITISISRNEGSDPSAIESSSPIKNKAIDYDKDSLIGQTFTATVGGLADIQDYEQSFTQSGITYTKKTADEIATETETRKTAISTYWDYDKISTPLTYTFVIVGVIQDESSTNRNTYIPEAFAEKMMQDYLQNQIDARNDTAFSDTDKSTFTGITYDGTQIQENILSQFGGASRIMGGMGGGPSSSTSSSSTSTTTYAIPGLVWQVERSEEGFNPFNQTTSEQTEYSDATFYSTLSRTGTTMLVKINDVANREQVISDLNDSGYAYTDVTNSEVYTNLKKNLKLVSTVLPICFIILTMFIIIFNMGKFVSESTKEIGIMRAIGATKGNIRNMFVLQSILYVFFSYVIGLLLGVITVLGLATLVNNWYDSAIGDSLRESFNVVQNPAASVFRTIDWSTFGIYSLVLLIVVVFISLIPAIRASNISPVTAIKGE